MTDMTDKIWYEFLHTKYGDDYLVLYLKRLRQTRKIVNVSTLVLSGSGIFSWTIWTYLPAVTSVITAIMQIFRLIENQLIPTDKDIEQVAKLREMYFDQSNKLEQLWIEYGNGSISEESAKDRFFELRDNMKEMKTLNNKINVQEIVALQNKAEMRTNDYIKQYHS